MDNETDAEKRERYNREISELRDQDRWLPINNVARLMKNTLPATTKVSKDAKECMQECVSEFISFVTSEACDRCISGKRKTINGEDILISLHALGFENYAEVLKIYLAKYRQQQAVKNQVLYPKREGDAGVNLGYHNQRRLDGDDDDDGDDGDEADDGHVKETNHTSYKDGQKAATQIPRADNNQIQRQEKLNIVVQEPKGSHNSHF